jgi:hypothetical protein
LRTSGLYRLNPISRPTRTTTVPSRVAASGIGRFNLSSAPRKRCSSGEPIVALCPLGCRKARVPPELGLALARALTTMRATRAKQTPARQYGALKLRRNLERQFIPTLIRLISRRLPVKGMSGLCVWPEPSACEHFVMVRTFPHRLCSRCFLTECTHHQRIISGISKWIWKVHAPPSTHGVRNKESFSIYIASTNINHHPTNLISYWLDFFTAIRQRSTSPT